MYVKAQPVNAQMAFTEMASVFLTRVLYSQRNGYDDDYSVISSRVSSCVFRHLPLVCCRECLQISRQPTTCHSLPSSFSCCQSSRLSDESRLSRSSRLDLTVRVGLLWSLMPNSCTLIVQNIIQLNNQTVFWFGNSFTRQLWLVVWLWPSWNRMLLVCTVGR